MSHISIVGRNPTLSFPIFQTKFGVISRDASTWVRTMRYVAHEERPYSDKKSTHTRTKNQCLSDNCQICDDVGVRRDGGRCGQEALAALLCPVEVYQWFSACTEEGEGGRMQKSFLCYSKGCSDQYGWYWAEKDVFIHKGQKTDLHLYGDGDK